MSKKPKPIYLWEIDPEKWYLLTTPDRATLGGLVKIKCDQSTTGWQRGHVVITTPTWGRAEAYYTNLFGSCGTIEVREAPQDYRYYFSTGSYPTLFEVPEGWVKSRLGESKYKLDVAQQEYNTLKELLDANALG